MNWRDRIVSGPEICHGIPCVKGTRVFASIILDNLAAGESRETILREYPSLRPDDIDAAIAYGAEDAKRGRDL